jgi:hypothetical protein
VKNPPPVDLTPLMQGAIATYELFTSYVQAGFTRDEALQLVIGIMRPPGGQS